MTVGELKRTILRPADLILQQQHRIYAELAGVGGSDDTSSSTVVELIDNDFTIADYGIRMDDRVRLVFGTCPCSSCLLRRA